MTRSVNDSTLVESRTAALAAAQTLAQRVMGRDLQLRRSFIMRTNPDAKPPPLARLMRGGRGGEVRLKLYLSLLWVGSWPPHDVNFPARAWAELLGLALPETNGARRVRDAIEWLAVNRFIAVTLRPGQPSAVTLLREDGQGSPYSVPGAAARDAKGEGRGVDPHRYVKLPHTFWTNGWITSLSTPGIAALLMLLAEQSRPTPVEVWLAPTTARNRYAFADDTRYKGLAELELAGIVHVKQEPVGRNSFDFRRRRNAYTLDLARLGAIAEVPPT